MTKEKIKKERLDVLIFTRGLSESREKARRLIMSGLCYVNGQKEDKPGSTFDETCLIDIRGRDIKYVSRGGLKLEKAVNEFGFSLEGKLCIDVGASTGGFTDCMLQNGASKVYAIDVGHGQLDWKLRNDPRVISMEKTNIRFVEPSLIGEKADFISVDVSFISLKLVLPVVYSLLKEDGKCVCLIKPQFEAGREQVGKKGVVKDKKVHKEVIEGILQYASDINFYPNRLTYSPVKGPEGNIEYLLLLSKAPENILSFSETAEEVVCCSHEALLQGGEN